MLTKIIEGFKQLLFPNNCLLCQGFIKEQTTDHICQLCANTLIKNTPPFCLQCGRYINAYSPQGRCSACLKTHYAFNRAWSVFSYQPPMDQLLHTFKYKGKTLLTPFFTKAMIHFINNYHLPLDDINIIIPMPLHAARLRERGYNQSQLLAEVISAHLNIPINSDVLKRARFTQSQALLEAKQRWTNLDGAFTINNPKTIHEKSILLVDDLLTTGATAHAAALCLKEHGASFVGVLTLAVT